MPSPFKTLLFSRSYWKAKSVLALLSTGILLNLAGWAWVLFVIRPTGDRILLHYTVQGGVDAFGPGTLSFIIPSIALGLLFMNAVIGALLFRFEKFLAYFALAAGMFMQALFFIGVVVITLAAG